VSFVIGSYVGGFRLTDAFLISFDFAYFSAQLDGGLPLLMFR
jgi:hypothetical protein